MSHNLQPSTAEPTSPYGPTEPALQPPLLRNPVGVAALIAAGVLVVALAVFQVLTMNAIIAGDPFTRNLLVQVIQPFVVLALTIVTLVLGIIGALQRGRVRLAAGIGLGVGLSVFVSTVVSILMNLGYSFA